MNRNKLVLLGAIGAAVMTGAATTAAVGASASAGLTLTNVPAANPATGIPEEPR